MEPVEPSMEMRFGMSVIRDLSLAHPALFPPLVTGLVSGPLVLLTIATGRIRARIACWQSLLAQGIHFELREMPLLGASLLESPAQLLVDLISSP